MSLFTRTLILMLLLSNSVFACAICTIYSPETKYFIEVDANDKKINSAKITWVLTKDFTNTLKEVYDTNANDFFEKEELDLIAQAIYDYVIPRNYLVHFSYGKTIDKEKSEKVKVFKKEVYIKNSILHFSYTIDLNYDIKNENLLYFSVFDEENYFILIHFDKLSKITGFEEVKVNKIATKKDLLFSFSLANAQVSSKVKEEEQAKIMEEKLEDSELEESLYKEEKTKDESILNYFVKKVKYYLVKIENGDNIALLMLLVVSFIYGMVHALGPGHGKSLAFSYFMANKSSYTKAFFISQASAFVHIIGALILVVFSIFILESILNNFVNDSVEILTKVSAVLIMVLAVYILSNKIRNKSCSCSSCCSSHAPIEKKSESTSVWSTQKPKNTTSLKPNFMKQDLYFVLTSGLIPCPGTVVLFIYAFVLKTYFAVFLASIAISLGMGVIIFASSFLGTSVNKLGEKSHKITYALEIIAPIFMFILGIFLYLNANLI